MTSDSLARVGLHFDELHKIRAVDPKAAQISVELKEESADFVKRIVQFQNVVEGFVGIVDTLSSHVEREKIKAVGSRNLLKSLAKRKDAEQQQLQALIREKQVELERLRMQFEALAKEEAEQKEFVQQFLAPV